MSRSSQSSRSSSSYSSGKVPLSCQSDSQQHSSYGSARYDDRYLDPRYTSTLGEPRSGLSSSSSSSKSGHSSKSDKKPLLISHGSSHQGDGRDKTTDQRYYSSSFLDPPKPHKKPLSCQTKQNDARYYQDSSYYR